MGVSVMAIIDLKCKHCGGTTSMDDSRETGFCSYCGNKFIVKEELVRIAIEYSGTINVDRNREIDNLLARAERFYSERRIEDAIQYCNRVLDIDINNDKARSLLDALEKIIDKPNVTIRRIALPGNSQYNARVILDNQKVGSVENGGTLQLTVPIGSHTIKVGGWQTWASKELTFSIVNRYSYVIVTYEPRAFSAKLHIHSVQTSIDSNY